jgi:hypothetical protein
MNLLRSRWSAVCVAVSLGCLLVSAAPARAQMFVELGGGWNYVEAASGAFNSSGSNIRASGFGISPARARQWADRKWSR